MKILFIVPNFDSYVMAPPLGVLYLSSYVKKYCNDIVCYYSDNDPYVKFDIEKSFADKIANRQYIIKNGGHINSETGYTKFEEILKEVYND